MHLSLPCLLASAKAQLGATEPWRSAGDGGAGADATAYTAVPILAAVHAGMLEAGFVPQLQG